MYHAIRKVITHALAGIVTVAGMFALANSARAQSPTGWKAPGYAARTANPIPATVESLKIGKIYFTALCAACHGNEGRGDGPAAAALQPKPRDLTQGDWHRQSDGSLFWKIRTGRAPMPTFAGAMSEAQIWQVVRFLRTLQPKDAAVPAMAPKYGSLKADRARVSASLASYVQLTAAMRNGDAKRVADAQKAHEESVRGLSEAKPGFRADALAQWQRRTGNLLAAARSSGKDTRAYLQRSTRAWVGLLSDFGHNQQESVWLLRWSAASGGAGGQWLQLSPSPNNPYGGAAQRRQGSPAAVFPVTNTRRSETEQGETR